MWPFKKREYEQAAVEFAGEHMVCRVKRDVDDRPYVVICGRFIRLDDEEGKYRRVVWLKRRTERT